MGHGRGYGDEACVRLAVSMDTFVRSDGGYTTVTVAVALLLSITLAFGVAAVEWEYARAADVQEIADASAMAGENCVAAFSTIAQVLDACVLSMGLLGVIVYGAGMVVAAIPVLQEGAPKVLEAGRKILDARKDFARSASKGLSRLEEVLPAAIVANSASTVVSNSQGEVRYAGIAVPYPQESESDYDYLNDDLDGQEMEKAAKELQEASAKKGEASERASAAKERAWRADNVDSPLCMQSRAQSLAGLSAAQNPIYADPVTWKFDYARLRAVNYYRARVSQNEESGSTPDELQRACARERFYGYAAQKISDARCDEGEDVLIDLPELPHTTEMVRATELYTDTVWPCTDEGGTRTLHCSPECPGAQGASAGNASLSDIDSGAVSTCPVCRMDARAMGNVADASTNIDNGFEHYWQIVVEASREYQAAKDEEAEAEDEMKDAAEKSGDAFEKAIAVLSVDRPKLCPPGAYGCIGFAMRGSTEVPSELTSSFLEGESLPAGVAVSGAVLAPDDETDGHNVLSSVFDGLESGDIPLFLGLLDGVTDLWGKLLVDYGSAYGSVADAADQFLDGVGGVFGEEVASWMRGKVSGIVREAGFEPSDMRLRKPVLTNTQNILDRAGISQTAEVRRFVESLPEDEAGIVDACRREVLSILGVDGKFTVAEIPVPGLDGVSIPLTVDLSKVLGV